MKRSRASTRVPGADVFFFFFRLGFRGSFVWRGGAPIGGLLVGRVCASTLVPGADVSFFFLCLGASLFVRDFGGFSYGAGARLIGGLLVGRSRLRFNTRSGG